MSKQTGFLQRMVSGSLGAVLLCSLGLPGSVGAVEMSTDLEAALSLCARCATIEDEELPAAIKQVRNLVVKLETEQKPANKVWLFRLKRCASFLDYRVEAAGISGEQTPGQ